jgi:CRISPR system Cascade subunit CasB
MRSPCTPHINSPAATACTAVARPIWAATAALGGRAGAQDAVRARFHALGTALDHDARLVHLRGLISQLRGFDISLDYARLAVDLYRLDDGTYADRVLLAWGRDYHRRPGHHHPGHR